MAIYMSVLYKVHLAAQQETCRYACCDRRPIFVLKYFLQFISDLLAVCNVKLCQTDLKTYIAGRYTRTGFALFCTAKLCTNGVKQLRLTGTATEQRSYQSEDNSCYMGNIGQLRRLDQTAQFQQARLQDTSVVHLGGRRDCSHS